MTLGPFYFYNGKWSAEHPVQMPVFTRIDGQLARWSVQTDDADVACDTVKRSLGVRHRTPVLALVE